MTQPGVYFTLEAPFVRVIGLFSNALEDPGVISSQAGRWPGVNDKQLKFLSAQLKRIKKEKYKGAVLLATHHPPYSYSPPPKTGGSGGNHGCSSAMLKQIDEICLQEGVYPHAVLSAHAHNYQRYTRIMKFGNTRSTFLSSCAAMAATTSIRSSVQAKGTRPRSLMPAAPSTILNGRKRHQGEAVAAREVQ